MFSSKIRAFDGITWNNKTNNRQVFLCSCSMSSRLGTFPSHAGGHCYFASPPRRAEAFDTVSAAGSIPRPRYGFYAVSVVFFPFFKDQSCPGFRLSAVHRSMSAMTRTFYIIPQLSTRLLKLEPFGVRLALYEPLS